jgi:hypothetical protein
MNPELAEQLTKDKTLADLFEWYIHCIPDMPPEELARWLIILKHEMEYRNLW